jgi:hypothetical protein
MKRSRLVYVLLGGLLGLMGVLGGANGPSASRKAADLGMSFGRVLDCGLVFGSLDASVDVLVGSSLSDSRSESSHDSATG